MKKLLAGMVVLTLTLAIGCEGGKPAGGPGATGASSGGHNKNSKDTFTLNTPGTTEMKQGETKDVKVSISRGKDFTQPVTLTFSEGKDVKVEPAKAEIPAGTDSVVVHISSTPNTPVGESTVDVTATPKTGEALKGTMKVKVDKSTK
jgi:hypothetical protein